MMKLAFLKSRLTRHWLPCVMIGLLLLAFAGCNDAPPSASQTPTPSGKSAPSRTNLKMPPADAQTRAAKGGRRGWTLLDNRHMELSDYLGQVVVLDFWATYCPPCLEEAPHLVELQRRYGPQGLHIIGINVGGPEDQPKVPAFVEQFKIQYMLGYPDTGTTELYLGDDTRIPQTLVFDRKGKLVKHFVGYDPQVSADLDRAIETALNTPAD
jgi:thiol-disulfide isomerase/thioredoxin